MLMNLENEFKAMRQRLNRQLGQKVRHAHAEIRAMAEKARDDLNADYTLIVEERWWKAIEPVLFKP